MHRLSSFVGAKAVNNQRLLNTSRGRLQQLNRLSGWWRPWLVISLIWILAIPFTLKWVGPVRETIHIENVHNYSLSLLLFDGKTFRTLTAKEESDAKARMLQEHSHAVEQALDRGNNTVSCWGKISTMMIPQENGGTSIVWSCESNFGWIARLIKNILLILFAPILLPATLMSFKYIFDWLIAGFEKNGT